MQVSVDFETRSTVDLRKTGVYPYSQSPDTDVWCMAWAIDDDEPAMWTLGEPFPDALRVLIERGVELRAWNAQFERVIWNAICVPRYGFPPTTIEQWHDTAAEAAAMALPRALGQCAQILRVEEQKGNPGYQFVLRMSRPRSRHGVRPLVWWDVPDRLQKLYDYCLQDVRTERAIGKAVRRLTAQERRVYELDQHMNERGMLMDVKLAQDMKYIAERTLEEADATLRQVTNGEVITVKNTADLRAWLTSRGVQAESVRKAAVRDMLAQPQDADVHLALELRQEAGKSSVAKIDTMLRARCHDNRLRGMLLYCGADTGRWSSRLVQVHNFPRGEFDFRPFLEAVRARDYDLLQCMAPPLTITSAMLRGLFIASPGHRLLVGDFAQIEARVLAWLAGQEDQLALFRAGKSPYPPMADKIYGLAPGTVTKKGMPVEYKMGKDTVLGCGYGMGPDKFRAQILEKEGHDVGGPLSERAVKTYRDAMTDVVALWRDMEKAARAAVKEPGSVQHIQGCKFTRRGAYLWLVLPSGRPLAYADPHIAWRAVPWHHKGCTQDAETGAWTCVRHEQREAVIAWGVDSQTKRWRKRALYGGLLVENTVQALARDMMAEAMLRLDAAGYLPLFTVHDEIITEVPVAFGTLEEFVRLATVAPTWAADCPIGFDAFVSDRYRKEA